LGVSENKGGTWTSYAMGNVYCIYMDGAGQAWAATSLNVNKIAGGVVYSMYTLQPFLLNAPPNGVTGIRTVCQGPHGGAAFGMYNNASSMYELGWPKNYDYHIPPPKHMCYENSTGKLWYTTYMQDTLLVSFDPAHFSEAFTGLDFDNYQELDVNMVRAAIMNRGDMHWDMMSAQYEVPKGGKVNADFAAALWIGGMDPGGQLHQAAMTYRQTGYDFWPGPLDTITGTIDSAQAGPYDKVWKVDRFKIEEFKYYFQHGQVQNGSYLPQEGIVTWPAKGMGNFSRNLAPFVDVNHNGIYDPLTGGDYPVILGDQEIYRIFNDNLAVHTESGGAPLKVEVHAAAYAYLCSNAVDSIKALNYTTFYHYDVYNRSANNYTKVYLGSWQDPDLGKYDDDYVGCSPSGNYGSIYNGAICDGTGATGQYGCYPPMMSTVILDGPLAVPGDGIDNNNNGVIDEPGEKNLMTCFHYYNNDFSPTGNPGYYSISGTPGPPRPMDYYNYLLGKWRDSTFITAGGNGYNTGLPTRFMFPDLPGDTTAPRWSEVSSNNTPGDRRFLIGCGPFDFTAGSKVNFDYALVFTRDSSLAPNSPAFFQRNRSDVQSVKYWWANNNAPSCLQLNVGIDEKEGSLSPLEVYPNPFTDELTISFPAGNEGYQVEVLDLTGKSILFQNRLASGMHTLNLNGLAEGMYFVKVYNGKETACKKVIKK